MSLLCSTVPRALDIKERLFGFELSDLVLIMMYLSVTNIVFGQTPLKIPAVWLGTLLLAVVLWISKKNKPERYLQHLVQYHLSPPRHSSGNSDTKFETYRVSEEFDQTGVSE